MFTYRFLKLLTLCGGFSDRPSFRFQPLPPRFLVVSAGIFTVGRFAFLPIRAYVAEIYHLSTERIEKFGHLFRAERSQIFQICHRSPFPGGPRCRRFVFFRS